MCRVRGREAESGSICEGPRWRDEGKDELTLTTSPPRASMQAIILVKYTLMTCSRSSAERRLDRDVKPVTSTKRHEPSSSWENTCMLSALAPRAWRPRSCHAAVRGTSASYKLPISIILSISQQTEPPLQVFLPNPANSFQKRGVKIQPSGRFFFYSCPAGSGSLRIRIRSDGVRIRPRVE